MHASTGRRTTCSPSCRIDVTAGALRHWRSAAASASRQESTRGKARAGDKRSSCCGRHNSYSARRGAVRLRPGPLKALNRELIHIHPCGHWYVRRYIVGDFLRLQSYDRRPGDSILVAVITSSGGRKPSRGLGAVRPHIQSAQNDSVDERTVVQRHGSWRIPSPSMMLTLRFLNPRSRPQARAYLFYFHLLMRGKGGSSQPLA